jgi:hypothetical protein
VICIFPNEEAAPCLIGALLTELDEAWQAPIYLDINELIEWAIAEQMLNDIGNNGFEMQS